jgi:mannose-6-phosphate isomerase
MTAGDLLPLRPVVRRYAWGSTTVIPELIGTAADGSPQAELWYGAHPLGPSTVAADDGPPLDAVVAADPERWLGTDALTVFGPRLPFLLKVLAVQSPLSLQVHPTPEQASAGFAEDEALGLPTDHPRRRFRDQSHKPELVLALSVFEALVGFRPPQEILALARTLGCDPLDESLGPLRADPSRDGLQAGLRSVLSTPGDRRSDLVRGLVEAIRRRLADGTDPLTAADLRRVARLAARFPGDPGVAAALLMRPVVLVPGEAVFVAAGVLHAYLAGTAVELQASSDNVLRAGLTEKLVDVPALLGVVDVAAATEVVPEPVGPGQSRLRPPVPDFALAVHRLPAGSRQPATAPGPQIVLCLSGRARVEGPGHGLDLPRGSAGFVAAGIPIAVVAPELALVVRATTNLP